MVAIRKNGPAGELLQDFRNSVVLRRFSLPFTARIMRTEHIFVRRTDIFVRSSRRHDFHRVRSRGEFAHSAIVAADRTAPFAANAATRCNQNRRKCSQRPLPRAH